MKQQKLSNIAIFNQQRAENLLMKDSLNKMTFADKAAGVI